MSTPESPLPWRWEDTPGAGLQIFAPVPFKADCIEFTLKAGEQPIFTLVAYEKWLQFPPKEWEDMQKANAALICRAVNTHAAFEDRMEKIDRSGDTEMAHADADDLMCEVLKSLGYKKGVEIFEGMEKWYA